MLTAVVVTVKAAVAIPAGTRTLPGTDANELLLDSATEMPPAGAAALSVTVPFDEAPAVTVAGLSDTEDSAGGGVTVSDAVWFAPL